MKGNLLLERVENGGFIINFHQLSVGEMDINKILNVLLNTDFLPNLANKNNMFVNFNSSDFTTTGFKQKNEANNCTIALFDHHKKNFYGVRFFVKNTKMLVSTTFYVRTRYSVNNLKYLLHTTEDIIERNLNGVTDIRSLNLLSGEIKNLSKSEIMFLSSISKNPRETIFYPNTVIKDLLDSPKFLKDCRDYEQKRGLKYPQKIHKNHYYEKDHQNYLFEETQEEEFYVVDNTLVDYLNKEE